MFSPLLFITALVLALLDMVLLTTISRGYGILLIIVTQTISGFLGIIKLKNLDSNLLFFLDAELKKGERIVSELWDDAMVMTAAILLIMPGYLSDAIGILFLIPSFRSFCLKSLNDA